mgnify:CR=1 FL=1
MNKTRKTYRELKTLRETLRREKSPSSFYKVEPMEFKSESVMVHYVKPHSEPIIDFVKFILFLMSLPLVMILVLLTAVLAISLMSIKDWIINKLF